MHRPRRKPDARKCVPLHLPGRDPLTHRDLPPTGTGGAEACAQPPHLSARHARLTRALGPVHLQRRAERFDSSRQLDFLADLTLGPSDNEDDNAEPSSPVREGVAHLASLLPPAAAPPQPQTAASTAPDALEPEPMQDALPTSFGGARKKGKNKKKRGGAPKAQSMKPNSKWADKCMYAELLEMTEDTAMGEWGTGQKEDGIPTDIESGWVAVTPVPAGKRCLAITHAPSGIAGLGEIQCTRFLPYDQILRYPCAVPNTTLRSRLLGKCLMKPFPSSLPPHTVLDCILDENWRDNGILHILDVVKWKGQDIADCETPFRYVMPASSVV